VIRVKNIQKLTFKRLPKLLLSVVLAATIAAPNFSTPVAAKALPGLADVAREVAAEGIVLLQNPSYKKAGQDVNQIGKVLPINRSENVAVFGRIQAHYYKSGTGSGGAVRVSYVNGILEGIRNNPSINLNEDLAKVYADWIKLNPFNNGGGGWAAEPWSQAEMPLTQTIIDNAKAKSDTAVVIIGRTAGEDKDNTNNKGAYRLTDLEVDMLNRVYKDFGRVAIVLNVANVIDMAWAKDYPNAAIVYAWQGGMEGGSAVADVLTGDVTPSGKLSDTIAASLDDYPSTKYFGSNSQNAYYEDIYVGYRYFETFAPDKVLYPFGYGLSYTDFETKTNSVTIDKSKDEIAVNVTVRNTGKVEGKEVVQVYYGAPQGQLGKAAKELAGFAKTAILKPGQTQDITITFDIKDMASYDDGGITGNKSAYVLEAGDYKIYVGNSVRSATASATTYKVDSLRVVEKLQEALAPTRDFDRLRPGTVKADGTFNIATEKTPLRTIDLAKRITDNLPKAVEQTPNKGYKLVDVYNKKVTLDEFIAQFTNQDLGAIILGEGMSSPKVTPGTASAFGGVTSALLNFGLPIDSAADGPSGIRMETSTGLATSIPNGTMIACTWNLPIVEKLFDVLGQEMLLNNIDTLLGPGVNIHRNPLNGRNFEYFSEDPLLTGMMAVVQTRGLQKNGTAPTIKHFAANNQEQARHNANSLVSERALREIYLKGYEMAVKSSKARSIMTSYGPVNGTWAATNYDLNTTILRGEWGFDGIVMTDWWAKLSEDQGFYANSYNETNGKAMVRAQNDLYMVIPDGYAATHRNRGNATFNTISSLTSGNLTLGELQRSAKNIVKFLMQSPAFARTANIPYKVDYTPGKDWFRVTSSIQAGNPQLTGITVGGKQIRSFNPLVLDYKAFGSSEAQGAYPTVAGAAGSGVEVSVVQATSDKPAAVITATAGGEKRIYKVIFTSEEGLEPIFDNPTYAYLKNILIDGKALEGFADRRLNYDVGLGSAASLPKVTVEANAGIHTTIKEDSANKRVTIKVVSSDQANTYVIQFGQLPQSDEFSTTSLSTFWKINTDTPTNGANPANWSLDPNRGSLRIIAERGDFWTNHTDLKNYFQQEAFGNWEVITKVNMNKVPSQNYNGVGITASQNNDNYIWLKYEYSSERIIGMVKETNGAEPVTIGRLTASQVTSIFGSSKDIYFKLKKIGNVYSGYVSPDGINYTSVGSTTGDYANPKFGLLASNGSTTPTEQFFADFDYVRFNTAVAVQTVPITANTKLKAAETETAAITPIISPVSCGDVDGGLCYTNANKGESLTYKVNVEKEGKYAITSRLRSSQSSVAQMSFGVYSNDRLLGTFDLTTTNGQWTTFSIPDVQLAKGEQNLRIIFESSGIDLNWLKFQLVQDNVDTSKLVQAIQTAEGLDMSKYTAYKKNNFNTILARIKLVVSKPINDAVVADAIAELQAAIDDLSKSVMPVNVEPKATEKIENGIRILPYNAPWIFTSNTGFRFEDNTNAMSYVNSNDILYLGKIDLTNLVEIRVQYAREAPSSPYFKFFTELDNTGTPAKRSTTIGRAYADVYSGGTIVIDNELASINFSQKAGATWGQYGIASTKQTTGNPYLNEYTGPEANFLNESKAVGEKNVYMRFNGLNANLQYVELIYDYTRATITFDQNYTGAPQAEVKSVTKGEAIGTLPVPVREGYIFGGWFTNKEASGDAITAASTIADNATFYAKWTAIPKIEVLSVNAVQPISIPFGTKFEALNLPTTVTATLSNNTTKVLSVSWSNAGYNADQAGSYNLTGTLTLTDGILNTGNFQAKVAVTVQQKEVPAITITAVTELTGRTVLFGTTFDKLDLPAAVNVTLSNNETKALGITWSSEGYNGNKEGVYTLAGTLVLQDGVTNPQGLKAAIAVTVAPEVVTPVTVAVKSVEAQLGQTVEYGTAYDQLSLPANVKVTLENGGTKELAVAWSSASYNATKEGAQTLTGTLTLTEGITNPQNLTASIIITVLPEVVIPVDVAIKSVEELAAKTVEYGTAYDKLNLPTTVKVTLVSDESKELSVTWSSEGYNPSKEGEYTLTGTLTLPEGISNPQNLNAKVSIKVLPEVVVPVDVAIKSVEELAAKTVEYGTAYDKLSLPTTVKVTLVSDETKELSVTWSSEGYNPNKEGEYALTGTLALTEGITNPQNLTAKVLIKVLPEVVVPIIVPIKSVEEPTAKTVSYGTAYDNLNLPTKVKVTLASGETKELAVTWSKTEYNGSSSGTYTLNGTLTLVDGISNPDNMKAKISVTVQSDSGGWWYPPFEPKTPDKPEKPETPEKEEPGENPPSNETPKTPAQIKEELKQKFQDAAAIPNWAEAAIADLAERKIINGRGNGMFDAAGNITRSEFISIVVKGFGFTLTEGQKQFTDVADQAWYKDAVAIGTSNGLIKGIGNDLFAPTANISRQDLTVMLYNALIKLNIALPEAGEQNFADDASIADYAKEAVYTFKKLGIIKGREEGKMDPKATATRAEAAVILYQVLNYYADATAAAQETK